jgi:hypothetical protein
MHVLGNGAGGEPASSVKEAGLCGSVQAVPTLHPVTGAQSGAWLVQRRLHLPGGLHIARAVPVQRRAGRHVRSRVHSRGVRRRVLAGAHVRGHGLGPAAGAAGSQKLHRVLVCGEFTDPSGSSVRAALLFRVYGRNSVSREVRATHGRMRDQRVAMGV